MPRQISPADIAWYPVSDVPPRAFDHHYFIGAGVDRLHAKLSYTDIGSALAATAFTTSQLRARTRCRSVTSMS